MKTKNVAAIIEASSSGFGIYTNDLPGITGYGDTIDEAKHEFFDAFREVLATYRDECIPTPSDYNNGDVHVNFVYVSPPATVYAS
ncbi:MAG TPA: hypothetical protein VK618_13695 [Flavitalea sp.]|nr:hypothetical protein [Flavitalea sp.]